jgi:hypothetical protein
MKNSAKSFVALLLPALFPVSPLLHYSYEKMGGMGVHYSPIIRRRRSELRLRRLFPAAVAIAMSMVAVGVLTGISAQGQASANAQANAEGIKITVDVNTGNDATSLFKFAHVPSPVADDAATNATLLLIAGIVDPDSGGLKCLTDGRVPSDEDEAEANFFFAERSWGGRFRMDLRSVIEIAQVNSYSWHYGDRGPQNYVLYASDGTAPNFDPAPKTNVDPTTVGWRRIARVDTRPRKNGVIIPEGDELGGQYGVSITHASGSIGKFRYLLFDCFEAETEDDWGNTFYSEIDVIKKR